MTVSNRIAAAGLGLVALVCGIGASHAIAQTCSPTQTSQTAILPQCAVADLGRQ